MWNILEYHKNGKSAVNTHGKEKIREWLREGAGSILLYFGFCILATIACATFVAYAQTHTGTEQAQLMADSSADSAAFAAYEVTRGWSMPWQTVRSTNEAVSEANAAFYGMGAKSKVKTGTYTSKSERSIVEASEQVYIKTQVNKNDASTFLGNWSAKRNARTEFAYAAGMEIVMTAFEFSKQCVEEGSNPRNLAHRTYYAWGGGRGGWEEDESKGLETMPGYADCSGFVHYIYSMCGYEIGGDTYEMGGQGVEVDEDDALPGDIVLFYPDGVPTHVGIYVGKNSSGTPIMIDCTAGYTGHSSDTHRNSAMYPSDKSKGVTVRPIYGNYYKFRRLITDFGEARDIPNNGDDSEAAKVFFTLMSMNGDDPQGSVITPEGACALMGNWYQEGGLGKEGIDFAGAMCETRFDNKSYCLTKADEYSRKSCKASKFASDSYGSSPKQKGYGIGQWTSTGRKINLFNFIHERGGRMDDVGLQAIFAVKEIRGEFPGYNYPYSAKAIKSRTMSLKEVTDVVYIEFEFGSTPTEENYQKALNQDGTIKTREKAAAYFYRRFVLGELASMKSGKDIDKNSIPQPSSEFTDRTIIQQMMYPSHFLRDMTIKMKDGSKRKVKAGEKVTVIKHRKAQDTVKFADGSIGYTTRDDLYYEDQIFDSTFTYKEDVITGFVNQKGYDSKTEWLFFCSKYNQHVYLFKGKKGNWKLFKTMKCGTGNINKNGGNGRDQGRSKTYEIYNKGNTTTKYAENKSDPNWMGPRSLQHWNMHYSSSGGNSIHSGTVGRPSTSGCIALSSKNAKWCYENLPIKTRVVVH